MLSKKYSCGDVFLFFGFFNSFIIVVFCYSFNVKDIDVINSEIVDDSYFGYSLLLQKGNPPMIIIGAPKLTPKNWGGSAFKCILDIQNKCEEIYYDAGPLMSTNGNFFGGTVDGENFSGGNFSICSHLWAIEKNKYHYPKGRCFYSIEGNGGLGILSPFEKSPESAGDAPAYHEYGLALTGLDHIYVQEQQRILLGVPGAKQFDGSTASCSIPVGRDNDCVELPDRKNKRPYDDTAYFGYKVATGRFDRHQLSYIAGAPRANFLKGLVKVYKPHRIYGPEMEMDVLMTYYGDEVGAYFGSAILATDVNNDGIDEILIGAPMSAGGTYDEGCVYFYMHDKNSFNNRPVRLFGSGSMTGSRFGSTMVSLGDFDLDKFNDVAISAPYEDQGIGAVYIYRGGKNGLQFSQKISPSDFTISLKTPVASFGLGMARGVDLDGNGHNDFAVGAYKSNQVFIIKTYPIIDFELSLRPNISVIGSDTSNFEVEFCFVYTQRSIVKSVNKTEVGLTLKLDDRSKNDRFHTVNQTVYADEQFCDRHNVKIGDTSVNISDFQLALSADIRTTNIVAMGDTYGKKKSIPIAHGCGADNVCNTKLSVNLSSNSSEIILGLDKEFQLDVEVTNTGEPAYQTKLKIELPQNVYLPSTDECERDADNILNCFVDRRLLGTKKKYYLFDVSDLDPNITEVEIRIDVVSLGHNDLNFTDLGFFSIPVTLRNSPYIVGKSDPDTIDLELTKDKEVEIIHRFTVGNLGPSPVKLEVNILLPVFGNRDKFDIDVKGSLRGEEISCTPNNSTRLLDIPELSNFEDNFNVPVNQSLQLTCFTEECVKYSCFGGFLVTSNEVAVFQARMKVNGNFLASEFTARQREKELYMVYIPMANVKNSTDIISASSRLTIIGDRQEGIPLWIIIVSILAGLGLLVLIVYGLRMFHFFDRVYKDKLQQEKILDSGHDNKEDLEGTLNEVMHNIELTEMEGKNSD